MTTTATGRRDDRAVSPVVGSVLMVAIVVLLVAVVGVMAMSFDDSLAEPAPVVSFDTEYSPSGAGNGGKPYVNITFETGQAADGDDLLVKDDDGNAVEWEEVWTGTSDVDTPGYVHIDGHLSDGALNHVCEEGQTYYVVSTAGGDHRVIYEVVIPEAPTSTPSGWC